MKIVTASNGKKTLKMSKKEWENIGNRAGFSKQSGSMEQAVKAITFLTTHLREVDDLDSPEATGGSYQKAFWDRFDKIKQDLFNLVSDVESHIGYHREMKERRDDPILGS